MASDPDTRPRPHDNHVVRLTHSEKLIYPEVGFSKQNVADYYAAVADVMLPQLANRVVTRIRYPDGVEGKRFFEKNAPVSIPDWIRTFTISASPGSGKRAKQVRYPVIDDLAGLMWMANQSALELHTPQWRVGPRGRERNPDRLVIDLDPGDGVGLDACAEVALLVADRLREQRLEPIPVTSGSEGIHIYAAINGKRSALSVHDWVMRFARDMAAKMPEKLVAVQDKSVRVGKVMIDWSQNHPARSTATPYTLRGKAAPTVAAPRRWEEITAGLMQLDPQEVVKRLHDDGDLMAVSM